MHPYSVSRPLKPIHTKHLQTRLKWIKLFQYECFTPTKLMISIGMDFATSICLFAFANVLYEQTLT